MDVPPRFMMQITNGIYMLAGAALLSLPATASDMELTALATSDWMYHGTSETEGEPAFGLAADWQLTPVVFAGIEAHQGIVKGEPQRQRSVMAYLGAGKAISDRLFLSGTASHREFPGGQKEWDFTEFTIALNHRSGWNFKIDYAPDYYEHNTTALASEVRYSRQFTQRLQGYVELGAIEFSNNRFTDYRYGQIGFGATIASAALDLAYRRNSEGPDADFGRAPYSRGKIVAQLSYRIH